MRHILIIGAGRSASSLIQYLLNKSEEEQLHLTIGDLSLELAEKKTDNHPNATALAFDIFNENQRQTEIQKADIVISMLPAHLHFEVAKDCIKYKKHMVTASYISEAMQSLDAEAKKNNLVFMNEIGLDPGVDHMSAMKIIDEIREQGGARRNAVGDQAIAHFREAFQQRLPRRIGAILNRHPQDQLGVLGRRAEFTGELVGIGHREDAGKPSERFAQTEFVEKPGKQVATVLIERRYMQRERRPQVMDVCNRL